jgi:hypothetical protein
MIRPLVLWHLTALNEIQTGEEIGGIPGFVKERLVYDFDNLLVKHDTSLQETPLYDMS